MGSNYEPKFKKGDKVTIEVTISYIEDHSVYGKFYRMKLPKNFVTVFSPNCKPFDKVAKKSKAKAKP